jgi:hypothetical protein
MDKITTVDGTPIQVLICAEDTIASTIAESSDDAKLYSVFLDTDEATLLVGIYEGRPTLEELADLLTSPDSRVLSSINKADGQIEIYLQQ